ncbi:helix-turn-helix domain-containing protein [Modestobacter roseus]|uniref:helix-turn-helix domain-containing protein n=1 Tax=Modestobacter roseus TaxID=1181884 RepID=UPI001E605ED4
MTLPQRSPAPALARTAVATSPRPASRGAAPHGYARPTVPGPRTALRPAQPMRPAPVQPMGQRPATQPPAPRAVAPFLTVAEVAGIMRVSKMTVYRLVHGGELAAVRVGRSFRVPEPAVRAYLAEARTDLD